MLDASEQIIEYTTWFDEQTFEWDRRTRDACLMQFQHIGETANKLRKDFGDIESLPMWDIIGFRNYIAHEYIGIDILDVWDSATRDIPLLKVELEKLLNQ
jgi:uncharacterized protein with HEPN domain